MDGRDLARGLQGASEAAYKAVIRPVEGTMLTVIRIAAEYSARVAAQNPALGPVLEAALSGARLALADTPNLLETLRQAGVAADRPAIVKGRAWLVQHQQALETDNEASAPWRAHSLNFDREHGGEKGEPWRRMFMSDLATAFAVLALTD
jgi:hypothetical protein